MFFLSCLLLSDPQYGTFFINVRKEILFALVLYPFMGIPPCSCASQDEFVPRHRLFYYTMAPYVFQLIFRPFCFHNAHHHIVCGDFLLAKPVCLRYP